MPAHGEFCWTEIASSDSAAAKTFYTNVFGWQFQDSKPGSEGFEYNEFSTGEGGPVGGLYQIDPQFFGGHAPPPHWMIYVAVNNVDEAAAKATGLGGTILTGPMDIPNVGRFCVVKDPADGALALFTMQTGGVTE
jgi:predicted enzyme related to lactoylglutathione lyase